MLKPGDTIPSAGGFDGKHDDFPARGIPPKDDVPQIEQDEAEKAITGGGEPMRPGVK